MNAREELLQQVTRAYLAAAEVWQGCDSESGAGTHGLNLAGLKSKQTHLLAEATSGEESRAWAEATRWLARLEQDARDARSTAFSAVEQAKRHDWEVAWAQINDACVLESQYHGELVWGPLRDLIAAGASSECESNLIELEAAELCAVETP